MWKVISRLARLSSGADVRIDWRNPRKTIENSETLIAWGEALQVIGWTEDLAWSAGVRPRFAIPCGVLRSAASPGSVGSAGAQMVWSGLLETPFAAGHLSSPFDRSTCCNETAVAMLVEPFDGFAVLCPGR